MEEISTGQGEKDGPLCLVDYVCLSYHQIEFKCVEAF